ncbi:MAG: hypothetical protein QXM43_04685 [Desulfurococcaceae archaeon]
MKLEIMMRQEGWNFDSLKKLLLVADGIREEYKDKIVDANLEVIGETVKVEIYVRDEEE